MDNVRLLLFFLTLASLLFMVIGLFKPWIMLWWEDVQNRRKIIRVYGTSALLFYLIYLGLGFIAS
jgi:hypothetical protein